MFSHVHVCICACGCLCVSSGNCFLIKLCCSGNEESAGTRFTSGSTITSSMHLAEIKLALSQLMRSSVETLKSNLAEFSKKYDTLGGVHYTNNDANYDAWMLVHGYHRLRFDMNALVALYPSVDFAAEIAVIKEKLGMR